LQPFVGKKVVLAGGGLADRVEKALPARLSTPALSSYYETTSGYCLRVSFKICEPVPPVGCCYAEASYTLGDVKDGVLVKVGEPPAPENWRTDYTVAEVKKLRKRLTEADNARRDLEHQLSHFGQYDT
jgi:hypothetical protein